MWLSLIAALSHHRVIGKNNQLPWHMPADWRYFKQTTLNKPVIMGRKTAESIGKPLPDRQNIVITRDKTFKMPGVDIFYALDNALATLNHQSEVFIIGGAELFAQTLDKARYLYLTFIDADLEGDTYFPAWHHANFREISRKDCKADKHNPYDYSFVVLENLKPESLR